jgi:predicted metal-dependent hydrolase
VAFDVYDHLFGDYFYRLRWGFFAQRHMFGWIDRVVRHMEESSPETLARFGGAAARRTRLRRQLRQVFRGLLPMVLATYLPGYSPRRIAFTAEMKALADAYTERALRVQQR